MSKQLVTVSSTGQVLIPADVRRRLGVRAGSTLELIEEGGEVRLKVMRSFNRSNVAELAGMLKATSRGIRRGLGDFDPAATMRAARKVRRS
jgi:antitoxin PrlF